VNSRNIIGNHQLGATLTNWTPLTPSSYHSLAIGKAFGMTDIGLIRTSNEDNFLIDPQLGLIMISDGMGGHDAGEVASKEALLSVRDFIRNTNFSIHAGKNGLPVFSPAHSASFYEVAATWSNDTAMAAMLLSDAVEYANSTIYAQNLSKHIVEGHGMGTTLTGFWQFQEDGPLMIFHVGDSRLYRLRAGELNLLTRDQTLYQQALDEGITEHLPPRNMLLQAIGPYATVKPEIKLQAMQTGDILLLCTDGLHESVSYEKIAEVMANSSAINLAPACDELIALAKKHGGRDNITVVMLAC
jgi:PPM family protein phosphatase